MHDHKTLEVGFVPASRIASISVSEILQIGARAAAMRAEGHPVITLGAGEPDFETPPHVIEAAHQAMLAGDTKYTPLTGTKALKAAIVAKFARENGLNFTPDQIIATSGAKQVINNAMMASVSEGDEVILPTPYWTSYVDIVQICGATPILVHSTLAAGFKITPEALAAAITPKTKWVFLNSPSNPSGAVYTKAEMAALMAIVRENPHVWVLADDIYEHIIFDGAEFVTPAQIAPDLAHRILTLNGVSKAYAMTGWRIGYGAGPKALIDAMAIVQSQSTSCPSSISQAAAVAALNGPSDLLKMQCASFQERRDVVVAALNEMNGLDCPVPGGAFYTFADCGGLLGRRTPEGKTINSDSDLCAYLLDQAHVAVVPGSAFGCAPCFRISYAASLEQLQTALGRIGTAIAALSAA